MQLSLSVVQAFSGVGFLWCRLSLVQAFMWCRPFCGAGLSVVQAFCGAGISVVQAFLWCRLSVVQDFSGVGIPEVQAFLRCGPFCGAGFLWCRLSVVQAHLWCWPFCGAAFLLCRPPCSVSVILSKGDSKCLICVRSQVNTARWSSTYIYITYRRIQKSKIPFLRIVSSGNSVLLILCYVPVEFSAINAKFELLERILS